MKELLFCPDCGVELPKDKKFCPKCGIPGVTKEELEMGEVVDTAAENETNPVVEAKTESEFSVFDESDNEKEDNSDHLAKTQESETEPVQEENQPYKKAKDMQDNDQDYSFQFKNNENWIKATDENEIIKRKIKLFIGILAGAGIAIGISKILKKRK